MYVYLLWSCGDLAGVFKTQELAQAWVDAQLLNGSWTAGEHAMAYIEPWPIYDHME